MGTSTVVWVVCLELSRPQHTEVEWGPECTLPHTRGYQSTLRLVPPTPRSSRISPTDQVTARVMTVSLWDSLTLDTVRRTATLRMTLSRPKQVLATAMQVCFRLLVNCPLVS